MAGKFEIDAIKMVRAIRDRHARLLAGRPEEEITAFYRKEAAKLTEPQPTVRRRHVASEGRFTRVKSVEIPEDALRTVEHRSIESGETKGNKVKAEGKKRR